MSVRLYNYCTKTQQFKTCCKDDCGKITQQKKQISKRRHYLAAHRRVVSVLTSNSAFDICCFSGVIRLVVLARCFKLLSFFYNNICRFINLAF